MMMIKTINSLIKNRDPFYTASAFMLQHFSLCLFVRLSVTLRYFLMQRKPVTIGLIV